MKLLTKEQQESCENTKICCICEEKFEDKYKNDKKILQSQDNCPYTVNVEMLHKAYVV